MEAFLVTVRLLIRMPQHVELALKSLDHLTNNKTQQTLSL